MRIPFAVLVFVGFTLGPSFIGARAEAGLSVTAASPSSAVSPLKTVAAIRALRPDQVTAGLPVELHAVLTYYVPEEGQIFVQDKTGGIYIVPPAHPPALQPGDAVVIRGVTVPSYAANVKSSQIVLEGASRLPDPVPVTWREILNRSNDCRFVSITGRVRSATLQLANDDYALSRVRNREGAPASARTANPQEGSYILMDIQTDGGSLRVHVEDTQGLDPLRLLDAEVRIEGVAGGLFDGKFQQLGAELWVSSARHMRIIRPATGNAADLPLTNISGILSHTYVRDDSPRVHVRGSITLYQPGLQLVVETPDRQAVLVNTYEQSPLRVGQVVDVVGFPYPHEYSEVISQANVLDARRTDLIQPLLIPWDEALAGHHPYDLVSMEGRLAAEVHERHQDTLIIQSGQHVFSAILPRTVWNQDFDELSLPEYKIGSTVRVTGVCFVHAGGPWNTERWFDLQMRTPQDVTVLANPSWWTVRHLLYLSAALVALMVTALLWAVFLHRKVRRQTDQIRRNIEAEAARERRVAMLEAERGRVLEAINSTRSLDEVLLMILKLMSERLQGPICWCELANGTSVGPTTAPGPGTRMVRRDIFSGAGERLGSLVIAGGERSNELSSEVMETGASLAALAIDNRRLYETLVHRSEYDQLTNTANRFLLENRLDEALANAVRNQIRCALIYIDLDDFKQVNDIYGHRVGDIYLQQVAERFSGKLRAMDTLARVGGDEFIALIPLVRNRAEAEDVSQRLTRCFDTPVVIDSHSIRGSASIGIAIYPEDGETKDELKRVADAAMYQHKAGVPR